MNREFHLSPQGKGGVACNAAGAFIGPVSLLARAPASGRDEWWPRASDDFSEELSAQYGLPIDMSSKSGGLMAIAKALNDGDVARAQIATVLLGIPEPPSLSKSEPSREQIIELVHALHWSGMLKWNPDDHPRWPAGSTEGKGGEFAPKGEGGETCSAPDTQSDTSDRAGASNAQSDPTISDIRNQFDDAHRGDASVDPAADDAGIFADYGHHIGDEQFASTAIPMGSIRAIPAGPSIWEELTRLANGSLKLGSEAIITAAELLTAMDKWRERDAIQSAMTKFQLNPSRAADILAARAYVWAINWAPWNFKDVPTSGPKLESVARSIMLVELARPGTLYFALHGDKLSSSYLNLAVQEGCSDAAVLESTRLPTAPAALQSTSAAARAAVNLGTDPNMQAHHLVPVNIIKRNMGLAKLASEAGWRTDSPDNLIALPANSQTQATLAEAGIVLPMQNSAHPLYDSQTQDQIDALEESTGSPLTPAKAHFILDKVAKDNLMQILSRKWQPVLKSS